MDVVAAVALGGVLTASSGATHHKMWTLADDKLHVLVARHASRLPIDRAAEISGKKVCVHWAKARISREVPVAEALQIVIDADHCHPRLNAVVIADSALNQGLIGFEELEAALPALAAWCDPASQSGTESMARVRLRRRGIKTRTQVQIHLVGFVDLVVGERLVIECDSAKHHAGYQSERDYDRDQELMRQGYLVLRLKYRHVVYEWDRIEQLVLGIVRARRHLWRVGTDVKGTFLAL